jgi:hypothetical protein
LRLGRATDKARWGNDAGGTGFVALWLTQGRESALKLRGRSSATGCRWRLSESAAIAAVRPPGWAPYHPHPPRAAPFYGVSATNSDSAAAIRLSAPWAAC